MSDQAREVHPVTFFDRGDAPAGIMDWRPNRQPTGQLDPEAPMVDDDEVVAPESDESNILHPPSEPPLDLDAPDQGPDGVKLGGSDTASPQEHPPIPAD